jgi:hypothetical protein
MEDITKRGKHLTQRREGRWSYFRLLFFITLILL